MKAINTKQSDVIATLMRLMVQRNSIGNIVYEVKDCDTKNLGHVVSVAISVGVVDETESARAFLREYRHFFVGTRGGVELVSVDMFNKFESVECRVKGINNAIRHFPKG